MSDKTITSEANSLFRGLRDCLTGKGIRKHGLFLIAGEKAVSDALANHVDQARYLLLCQSRHADKPVAKAATQLTRLILARELFDELDPSGTHSPIVAMAVPEIPAADLTTAPQGLEILCAMGDPANVGALLRSAAAFGAAKIVLLKESASPFHPKAVRAASAATLVTPFAQGPSIREIPSDGEFPLLALDMGGESINDFKWPKDARILIGEEGRGLPEERPANLRALAIPISDAVESLNAPIAASLALYSYRRVHPKTKPSS